MERDLIIQKVVAELDKATKKFPKFNSAHEGYAVIKEELEEAWEEIKENDNEKAKDEMIQVAAMAVRFVLDV